MGVMCTRNIRFLRKGPQGDKGEQGAALRGPQDWTACANGYAFKQGAVGEAFLDVVMYNGYCYICKKSHTKTSSNYPGSSTSESQHLWQLGDMIDLVATRVLLAENAVIAGWVFRNNRLESQDGRVYLDGINGSARLNGILQLSCATSGAFEDANIYYLPAVSTQREVAMAADIKHIGKVIRMYNSGTPGTHKNYRIYCKNFGAAADGSISWEDMSGYYAIIRPGEWAEFTCIVTSKTASETDAAWELSGRFSQQEFINSEAFGRFPLVLAMGRFNGADTVSSITINGSLWNKADSNIYGRNLKSSPLYVTREGPGIYDIYALTTIIPNGSMMVVNGYGCTSGYSDRYVLNATVASQFVLGNYTHFRVIVHDDDTPNDGSFNFVIFAPYWGYSLS